MTRAARALHVALMVEDFPVISETFVVNAAAGLLERGHDVSVLAMSGQRPPDAAMHESVTRWKLERRTTRPPGGGALIGRFRRDEEGEVPARWGLLRRGAAFAAQAVMLVSQPRFDVVHCQFAHLGLAAQRHRRARTLRADRLVVHLRGQDVTSFVRAHGEDVYRDLFGEADLLIANCNHFRDRAVALGAPPGRVRVIGSAIDCAAFSPPSRRSVDADRETYGEGRGDAPPRLIAIGRLVPKKGFEDAIRAVAEVAESIPGIRLEIVGEGPLRVALEALARELGADEAVRLVGALPHEAVVARLAAADALLAPSVTAASGDQDAPVNSLKEAMAMERPVIGTRHGGIPELIEEGRNGYLVAERDPAALAAAIRRLAAERTRWREMGEAGRRRVLEEYDLPVVSDRLIDAYRSLFEPEGANR